MRVKNEVKIKMGKGIERVRDRVERERESIGSGYWLCGE
jgi:hypothetical protein